MAVALGAVFAVAAGPPTGDRIRAALPQPGKNPSPGTVQFAGQDATKTFNVAVVRSGTGVVLAYVCDGASTGRWLTGEVEDGVAQLTGRGGATLRAVFRTGRVSGSARIDGRRITFTLAKTHPFAGLRRTTAQAGGTAFRGGLDHHQHGRHPRAGERGGGQRRSPPAAPARTRPRTLTPA